VTLDRVEAFRRDIDASAQALATFLDRWQPPELGGRAKIAFTGLGSSRYAALVASAAARAAGRTVWASYPHVADGQPPTSDLVLVAISASGRTSEVVEVAERHRGRSLVVAVTGDPGSPLARAADQVVPLHAGREVAGVACRTFRATVAALGLLTGVVEVEDVRPTVDALDSLLTTRTEWAPRLVEALDGAPSIDVLADAPLVGLAEQAALMLRECPRSPAHAWESADWLHTAVYLALPGHRVVLYPGAVADEEVVATVERRGGSVLRIPGANPGGADPLARAVAESVVAEVVAAELWARTRASDKEP